MAVAGAGVFFYVPTLLWNLLAAPSRMERDSSADHQEIVVTQTQQWEQARREYEAQLQETQITHEKVLRDKERIQEQLDQIRTDTEASITVSRCFIEAFPSRQKPDDEIMGYRAVIEFFNNPAIASDRARLRSVRARNTFLVSGNEICTATGIWRIPPHELSMFEMARNLGDFSAGDKRILEIAFRTSGSGRTYASDSSTRAAESQEHLNFYLLPRDPMVVKIYLDAISFNAEFWFALEHIEENRSLSLREIGNLSNC